MRLRLLICLPAILIVAGASSGLQADPGDVESSHDYPDFPRLPGFIISDYDEDNPAEFDFPVARPLPIDANHVEKIHVKGHRYVIRYERGAGAETPNLMQTQQYYEKLALAAGYTLEKTGAVGDVSETFRLTKDGRDFWVYLDPAMTVNILTIVDSKAASAPVVKPKSAVVAPTVVAAAVAPSTGVAPPGSADEDPFYTALVKNGRVVLPLNFLPGKPDLDADSQPVMDRVVKIMQNHPELFLEVVGHTDNSGDANESQRLSEQRAKTVRGVLIADHIEKSRLVAMGMGGSQAVADDNTAEGREKNRRIELVVPKDMSRFHTPAPNGTNYYPGKGGL